MKGFFLFLFVVFIATQGEALPLSNPAEASLLTNGSFFKKETIKSPFLKAVSFRSSYYGDFVFNRFLETKHSTRRSAIEKVDILTNALYFAMNFWERFDLFGLYGKSRFSIETNANAFGGISGNRFSLKTSSGASWSVGSRLTVFNGRRLKMGVVGGIFSSKPEIDRITLAETDSLYLDSFNIKYLEWQIGAGIALFLFRFVPYLGLKYSRVNVSLTNTPFLIGPQTISLAPLKNQKHVGGVIGISLLDSTRMSLILEARFFDETAVYINRQMRF